MRDTEKKLEKKRKKKGGSNGENLEEREKKEDCPFDAKKICPVTLTLTLQNLRSPKRMLRNINIPKGQNNVCINGRILK